MSVLPEDVGSMRGAFVVYRSRNRIAVIGAGWLIAAAGTGVIYLVATQYLANEALLSVSGAILIMVGISTAIYSGSFRQWRRRLWLVGLGLLVLAAGALAAGSIVAVVAVAVAQDPTPISGGGGHRSESLAFYGVVVVGIASVSLVGAVTIFVKAWRTPAQPLKQGEWHQVGR
jgi:hypothetical protein